MAIGSTKEFAAMRADIDETRADVDTLSEALDATLGVAEPARVAAARPTTTAKATSGCGLTVTAGNAVFNACNVHVQSGEGATWGIGTNVEGRVNGLGNLIVGYDEPDSFDDKTGSHNLIVGTHHSYPSYGGFVGGYNSTASGVYSSVSGGSSNTASGLYSSVSGGLHHFAIGTYSWVSGGYENTASADWSSISGGRSNQASAQFSSVSGGIENVASGETSSVSGGYNNAASGFVSSVLGGQSHTASDDYEVAP